MATPHIAFTSMAKGLFPPLALPFPGQRYLQSLLLYPQQKNMPFIAFPSLFSLSKHFLPGFLSLALGHFVVSPFCYFLVIPLLLFIFIHLHKCTHPSLKCPPIIPSFGQEQQYIACLNIASLPSV